MRSLQERQNAQSNNKIMVSMLDEDGVCRAWATGPTTEVEDVKQVAKQQLDKYIEKKKSVGDSLAYDEYTMSIKTLSSK
jgi:hypothetical protein